MRGLAALAVCLCHLTIDFASEDGLLRSAFRYGWAGVEVFFVISGFVIPFSLLSSNFRIGHYFRFMLKRIYRLEPSYIISLFFVIILNFLASSFDAFNGDPYSVSFSLILQHFGYLVNFFDNEWINPVYWTLEVEFHYYLLVGVFIALWNYKIKWLTILTVFGLLTLSFLDQDLITFFKYTDIFIIGIITAFYKKERVGRIPYIFCVTILAFVIFTHHGFVIMGLSTFSAAAIAFADHLGNYRPLIILGNISYSFYLVHLPIGGKIINLSKRLELTEFEKFGIVILATLASIAVAHVFYYFVEKPSHKWARRINFRD